MNDPQTLNFFTELLLFKKDASREIMIFPPTVTPEQRRQIHILAHNMGLEHQSVGDSESRQIHVLKPQAVSPTAQTHTMPSVSLDLHKRGLSRAATFDFAVDRESRNPATNYAHAMGRHGPMLELPGSPDGSGLPNNLRSAKSFADLRTLTPSPSASSSSYHLNAANGLSALPNTGHQAATSAARFGDYGGFPQGNSSSTPNLTPNTPGQSNASDAALLTSGIGSLNIGSFEPAVPQSQLRSTPGAIGSQRPGASRATTQTGTAERQPRGADWDNPAGSFTPRGGRANGHVQRGSGKLIAL
jgi:R3H domain